MKKLLGIVFFLLLLCPQFVNAQKGFYMGISGNVGATLVGNQNLYGVVWSGIGKFDPAHSFTVGYGGAVKLGFNFSPPLGILIETGYQSRGQQYEDIDSRNTTHIKKIELDYITTGVYFRYSSILKRNHYKQQQKVRLAIVVGPQVSYLYAANQTYGLSGDLIDLLSWPFSLNDLPYPSNKPPYWSSDYNFIRSSDDKQLFRNIDVGLVTRIGVDFYPKPWLFVSPTLSTYLAITDLNHEDYSIHSGYAVSRNLSVGLDISLGFYLKSKTKE